MKLLIAAVIAIALSACAAGVDIPECVDVCPRGGGQCWTVCATPHDGGLPLPDVSQVVDASVEKAPSVDADARADVPPSEKVDALSDARDASVDAVDARADVARDVVDARVDVAVPAADGAVAQRPAGNTGTGFFVVGSKLFDANGAEFRIRGLNHLHWDAPGVGIPKTGANTERWVLDFNQSATTNAALLQRSITNHMVPMPGNWDTTCTEDTAALTAAVDTWVAQAARFKPFERYALVNIANEWGPDDSTVWRDSYVTAVSRMRAVGYLGTIVVDAGGCGQGVGDILHHARAVFDSDPQRNLLFDFHAYGFLCTTACESWQFPLAATFDAFAATGLPIVIGEFGPGRSIGPSPTLITPLEIIRAAESHGFSFLAWSWDDPAGEFTSPQQCPPNDNWFALSCTGDYRSSADLTTFGRAVVEDPSFGLKAIARPATVF